MGSMIQAICECGFESEVFYAGAGMMDFKELCLAPAICLDCKKFLIENYKNKDEAECPVCNKNIVFYNDPRVKEIKNKSMRQGGPIFEWRLDDKIEKKFMLDDGRHLCPECGKLTLLFKETGCWD